MDEFTDPSGPDEAETPGAASDGKPHSNVRHLKGKNGGSIAERTEADAGELEEGEQGELFVTLEGGRKVTLGSLVRPGTPIEHRFVMSSRSQPASGGLLDPYRTSHMLIADCVLDHVRPQFIRDSNQRVEKVILYSVMKPRRVQDVSSEAGQQMLRESIEDAA